MNRWCDMTDVLVREIWVNDVGADSWADNETDGRRIFWVPGDSVSWPVDAAPGGGLRQYDDTASGFATLTHAVDEFKGGPAVRREHYFDIPTLGYQRLWIQWSGECVSSAGFNPIGVGAPNGRSFFGDELFCQAHGMCFTDPKLRMTVAPPAVIYNDQSHGGLLSTMGQSDSGGARDDDAALWANSMRLYCMAPGQSFPGFSNPRGYLYGACPPALTPGYLSVSSNVLTKPVLFYGYVEFDGVGVARAAPPVNGVGSRMPLAGDRYGFLLHIGWPTDPPIDLPGVTFTPAIPHVGELTVEPFERVFVAVHSGGNNGANVGYGVNSHFVKGRLYAVLTKPSFGRPERIYIDRQGRVTVEDATTFQIQGRRRG